MKTIILIIAMVMNLISVAAYAGSLGALYEQITDTYNVQKPTLSIAGTASITNNQSSSLTASATYCSTCSPLYFWEADGGTFSGNSNSATATWTPPVTNSTQTYSITCTVGDGKGNIASASFPVTVTSASTTCTSTVSTPFFYDPGMWSESTSVYLGWQSVNNATQYLLQESTTSNFATSSSYTYGASSTWTTLTNRANDIYYYRVQAQNSCGSSGWSNTVLHEVKGNLPPNTPSSPFPANGATNTSRTTRLEWTGGDPDGTADYAVEHGTDPNNMWMVQGYNSSNKFNNAMQISWSLNPATNYYWRVRAKDDKGAEIVGPTWSFTTSTQSADLVPIAMNVTGSIANGTILTVDVTVQNQGDYASDGGQLRYYYSPYENGQDFEYVSSNRGIPVLNPGASVTVSTNLNFSGLQKGNSFLVAKIDTLNSANELDVSNNAISYLINYTDTTAANISFFAFQGASGGQYRTNNQYFITYTVLDDIGISGVNLDYSTDSGSTWNSIVSNFPVTSNGGGNGFYWTIPGNVPLNNTFMLKVTASDTSGNSSAKMIGPYTIIDGSTPTVTVTAPAKGDVWKLGETKNITWTASSPNGIKKVSVSYQGGSGSSYHLADFTSNTGSYSLAIPTSASYASNNAYIRVYVEDNNGNGVWVNSESFQVVDASAPPLPPWGVPVKISTIPTVIAGHIQEDRFPAIAIDSQGDQHFIDVYVDDNNTTPKVVSSNLMYMKKTGSPWGQPAIVKSLVNSSAMSDLKITIDSNDRPHIVWYEISGTSTNVWYSYYNGSSWLTPVLVSNNPSAKLKLIINNNETNFFWLENLSSSPQQLFTRKYNVTTGVLGTTSKVVDVQDSVYDVARQGATFYVVYSYFLNSARHIGCISNSGAGWSAPQELVPGFDNYKVYNDLSLSADTRGGVHLGGITYAPTLTENIIFYSSLVGGTWSAPENVFSTTREIVAIKVNADSTGKPNLLFTASPSSGPNTIKYLQRKDQLTWSSITIPILTSQNVDLYQVSTATNSAMNKLYLAYVVLNSGHEEIYTNTADLTMDVVQPTVEVSGILNGQIVNAGSVVPISWTASDDNNISSVTLKYSTDGGTTFNTIASDLAASGTYQWTVPNISTTSAQIVAYALDAANNQGTSQSPLFTINYTPTYTLNISRSGTGAGSVSSNPTGISCGSICSATYTITTQLTLTATADQYSTFTGWSGVCSGTGPCTINVDADKAVVATFTNNSYSLTVNVNGNGTGAVTSVPSGILCSSGSSCISRYVTNQSVVLTATPLDTNSKFSGWGGACSGMGTCSLSMDAAKNVTAMFAINSFTVTPSAGANGTITPSTPQTLNYNGTTSFTVTPSSGYSISSVSGCGGTLSGNTYTTGAITGNCTVTAGFVYSVADTTAPSAPTGLTAIPASSGQINLSWTASTDNIGVVGYQVYRSTTDVASVNATSYSNTGLSAGTQYCYTVKAIDAAGNISTASSQGCTTTPAAATATINDFAGTWTGSITFAVAGQNTNCTLALALAANSNQVTGTMTGSNCSGGTFGTSNISGTVSNNSLSFNLPNSAPTNTM